MLFLMLLDILSHHFGAENLIDCSEVETFPKFIIILLLLLGLIIELLSMNTDVCFVVPLVAT